MSGGMVAWMSTKFPLEIPAAFDLQVCCPESGAGAAALRGESGRLCRRAEQLGYIGDLCSYTRIALAWASDGKFPANLPRPDVLLCCDNICSNMIQWYEEMARVLQVPLFLLDIPFQREKQVSQRTVAYLRSQMEEIIAGLEVLTGTRFDEAKFEACCRNANRSAQAWQRVLDTAQSADTGVRNMEFFDYMPLLVTGRCREELPEQLEQLARELEARPASKGKRPYRIFLEGTPCWPELKRINAQLEEHHVLVAADTLTPSLGFRYDDLDGLARAYCTTVNGSCVEAGVEQRVELCRRFRVEGVLVHYNRSCRPWCGVLPQVERRLREELDIPVVSFGGDQADPSVFSLAQFETRLEGLCEIMEARRG